MTDDRVAEFFFCEAVPLGNSQTTSRRTGIPLITWSEFGGSSFEFTVMFTSFWSVIQMFAFIQNKIHFVTVYCIPTSAVGHNLSIPSIPTERQ